jgi:integrase
MPRKRANGDGSFYQRPDGTWQGRIVLPGGRRKSVYGPTRASVREKLVQLRSDAAMGLDVFTKDQLFGSYLQSWLEDVAGPAVRPSTRESYESLVRVRVLPHLGSVKLSEVTPQRLQALYSSLSASGLSPASVGRTHAVLHAALKQALLWNLIPRNPAAAARPPSAPRSEMQTLTRDEVQRLVAAAGDATFRCLYLLAATAGLRRGELVGLRWSDIDLDRGQLTVLRTAQRIKAEGIVFGEPKTKAGRRTVRLGSLAVSALRTHRPAQLEQRLKAGPAWTDTGLVFTSARGTPIEEARLTRTFKRDLEVAGLPAVRFHDLRHTAATLLIEQGVAIKAVQSALGHSTIAVTMDTYAHVTPAMQDSVAETIDRLFGTAEL